MQHPSCQHDHLARLPCSQAGPRCRGRPPASWHQHRAAARCSGGMESPVRGARVESAITHVPKQRHCHRSLVLFKKRSGAAHCAPGTGILDAETGPRKSPPEATRDRRDQEAPESIAEIPAQTAYRSLTRKYPVRGDWVVETGWIETGCPPLSLSNESPVGARNGNFRCRDRATKSAILARIQRQRLRKPKNQGRMSLTSRPYRECLFHTRRQAGLDSQRPEASGFGRNFSNPDERW